MEMINEIINRGGRMNDDNIDKITERHQHEKTIKEFLTEMTTQDNHSTRLPIYFTIRDEEWMPNDRDISGDEGPGSSEKTAWIHKEDPEYEYDTKQDLVDDLLENGHEDYLREIKENYEKVRLIRKWNYSGMFLTESDANEHFERNRYHYSENAHVYVCHAWRAPKLKGFIMALNGYFDIDATI